MDRQKTMANELEWIKMGRKARNIPTKHACDNTISCYKAGDGHQERRKLEIIIPNGPRLGDVVVSAKGMSKGFGERLLIDDLNFDLPKGGIVGVIGANGAGKTTLFKMITGEEKPDNGNLTVGSTVSMSHVGQFRDDLDDNKSIWEIITGGVDLLRVGTRELNSRAYCAAFGFKGSRQNQKVGTLSGGERNRVHLAKLLQSGGNLLLLDEPTNDLDVETLRTLEAALDQFAGCVMTISHDRWFLDRVATHILAFEGDSKVIWFEGNYEEYERDRRARYGENADQPRRIKYKPLQSNVEDFINCLR